MILEVQYEMKGVLLDKRVLLLNVKKIQQVSRKYKGVLLYCSFYVEAVWVICGDDGEVRRLRCFLMVFVSPYFTCCRARCRACGRDRRREPKPRQMGTNIEAILPWYRGIWASRRVCLQYTLCILCIYLLYTWYVFGTSCSHPWAITSAFHPYLLVKVYPSVWTSLTDHKPVPQHPAIDC